MKRFFPLLLCALCLLLSGCVADIDALLVPPTPEGEQQAIRQALTAYVQETYGTAGYLLRYPAGGSYTSAFIAVPGEDDRAVALYSPVGSDAVHVHLLRRVEERWYTIGDVEELHSAVEEVYFADLDGDGRRELLIGWSIYNSTDRALRCYTERTDRVEVQGVAGTYTRLLFADLTGDGVDDAVLLRYSAEGKNTARLLTMYDRLLIERGSTRVDGYIRSVLQYLPAALPDGARGLFIDAETGGDSRTTELLRWDGTALSAPFYDPETNTSPVAARTMPLLCVGSGDTVQYPTLLPLEGEDDTAAPEYLVAWYAFGEETPRRLRFYPDGVTAVCVAEEWVDTLRVDRAEEEERLTLTVDGRILLELSSGEELPDGFTEWYRADGVLYGARLDRDHPLALASLKGVLIRREDDR